MSLEALTLNVGALWLCLLLKTWWDYGHLCLKVIWDTLGQFPLGTNDEGKVVGKNCLENPSGLLVSWA